MAWRMSTGLKNALLGANGLKEAFANGQIRIFAGPQPDSADTAESGQLLCVISLESGAMTSGVATNGINFGTSSGGQIGKSDTEVWSGKNLADGSAGWFRWYPNAFDLHTGASTDGTKIRLDGACGTIGSQMLLPSVLLKRDATTTVDNVSINL